mmetsp:Transcript_14004/g.42159  ORF Transcript_14004/g.42159 Transcript_14004/m.42159 type:complete len:213 (-) Transcript_14004:5418-6056(-)
MLKELQESLLQKRAAARLDARMNRHAEQRGGDVLAHQRHRALQQGAGQPLAERLARQEALQHLCVCYQQRREQLRGVLRDAHQLSEGAAPALRFGGRHGTERTVRGGPARFQALRLLGSGHRPLGAALRRHVPQNQHQLVEQRAARQQQDVFGAQCVCRQRRTLLDAARGARRCSGGGRRRLMLGTLIHGRWQGLEDRCVGVGEHEHAQHVQ